MEGLKIKLIDLVIQRDERDKRPPEEWRVRVSDLTTSSQVKTALATISPKIVDAEETTASVNP